MIPLYEDQKISLTLYSLLAGGKLARDWSIKTTRAETDEVAKQKYVSTEVQDKQVVDRFVELAGSKGMPRSQLALAWLLHKKQVVSLIIGETKEKYLDDAVAAVNISLNQEEMVSLEELYVPHEIVGALAYLD